MSSSFIVRIFVLALLAFAPLARAAGWGPNGHPELTYDAATSPGFAVPADVARVMSLGSIVPDYFEFTTPAAHAQVPDPPLSPDGKRITLDPDGFRRVSQQSFRDSEKWHDFYFDAAVDAMKKGHREQAAFLLGYALHNRQDLGTHRGWTNLAHAALDGMKKSPDADPKNLATAHALVSLELERFREKVGSDNWQLFRGQAVRKGLGSIVPAPMGTLAPGLEGWNPRNGDVPSGLGNATADKLVDAAKKRLMELGYKPNLKGEMPYENLAKFLNFTAGLLPRQDAMAQLLDVPRGPRDPRRPTTRNEVEIATFAEEAVDFGFNLPGRFNALDSDVRQTLLDSRNKRLWTDGLAQRLQELRDRRQAMARDLLKVQRAELERLKTLRGYAETARASTLELRELEQRDIRTWGDTHPAIANLSPPTIDGTPKVVVEREEVASTSSGGSSSSSHESYTRREPRSSDSEREPSRIRTINSPTFNQLRSGNYSW